MFIMQVEAEALKHGIGRVNVPGLGNILELPFELNLVRGPPDWKMPELPPGVVGFLACYESRFDELGVQRTLIGGSISVPEAVYDDIWERVRMSPDFYSLIFLKIGPVRAQAAEGLLWDRAKDKFLIVSEADVAFKRDVKDLSTQGRR